MKIRKTEASVIDQLVWKFFCVCRAKNVTVSGPLLKGRALEYANGLKINDFHASEGWLDKFKQRHNIKLKVKKGECANVDSAVVDDWNSKLKLICAGYEFENLFDCDETGLFFKCTSKRTLACTNDVVNGGKKSILRLTILFCVSMTGEKLKPLVIGKSNNPRCFKSIQKDKLPVTYRFNQK